MIEVYVGSQSALYSANVERSILLSSDEWLNDKIMDAAQKLLCAQMGEEANFQSVLNIQLGSNGYFVVNEDLIQLLHNGCNHWLASFVSAHRAQVCDSLYGSLTDQALMVWNRYIKMLCSQTANFR